MPTDKLTELTRAQIKEIKILASMLEETATQLDKLAVRRHPDLTDAYWLIKQAQKKVDSTLIKLS